MSSGQLVARAADDADVGSGQLVARHDEDTPDAGAHTQPRTVTDSGDDASRLVAREGPTQGGAQIRKDWDNLHDTFHQAIDTRISNQQKLPQTNPAQPILKIYGEKQGATHEVIHSLQGTWSADKTKIQGLEKGFQGGVNLNKEALKAVSVSWPTSCFRCDQAG